LTKYLVYVSDITGIAFNELFLVLTEVYYISVDIYICVVLYQ